MKYLILLTLLTAPFISSAQTIKDAKKQLKKINSLEQINELMEEFPEWNIEQVILEENRSTDKRIF